MYSHGLNLYYCNGELLLDWQLIKGPWFENKDVFYFIVVTRIDAARVMEYNNKS